MFELLILAGSLRTASRSAALGRALGARLPEGVVARTFDIGRLPHYNADIEGDAAVAELNDAVRRARGLLIVTPEYNYSIPGVLKNALDWASRPAYQSVLRGKPVFVISVSGGALGGVRAQAHLKYVLNGVLAQVFPSQEVAVPQAGAKMVDGHFEHEGTMSFVLPALEGFIAWARERG